MLLRCRPPRAWRGPSLAVTAGAHHRRLSRRRGDRHPGAPDGQWLSERLGQQFIIENRAGASGNIGTEAVAKAPADGYTLLQIVTPNAINAALYTNLSFDFLRDIAPVICVARLAYVVVVHPSVPVTTIPEFIAYAKANPGKINYGSAGPGTPQNIACEQFKMWPE